jgi:hypothetical protein
MCMFWLGMWMRVCCGGGWCECSNYVLLLGECVYSWSLVICHGCSY